MKSYANGEEIKGVAIAGQEVLGVAKAGEVVYKKILEGYTMLKSLISVNTAHIITDVFPNTDAEIRLVFSSTNNGANTCLVGLANRHPQWLFIKNDTGFIRMNVYNRVYKHNVRVPLETPQEVHYKDKKVSINGVELYNYGDVSLSVSLPFRIFSITDTDLPRSRQKIHEVELRLANGDHHHFVPAMRRADNEVGMLDKITGKFYTSVNDLKFGFEEF